jgi:flagellar hook-associated protein 2
MTSFGFGTITSQGVGSNLDVAGIVRSLMQIERAPLDRLIEQKDSFDAKISALGKIKSSLSAMESALAGLTSGSSFLANSAESSDTTVVKATGTSGGVAGNYSIEVSQLAQSQKLVAAGQADNQTAIGVGTLTIDLGTISGGTFDEPSGTYTGASFTSNGNGPFDIVIDSSNNTLEGIRDAINDADIGVSASIVNDGDATNPYRLVLSSAESGVDQSISISVAGDAALSNLLSHDPSGTQNLSETVTAQNANFTVDGLPITKSSNTVTDVIEGATLDLTGATSGSPVNISVTKDTDSAKTAVEDFVKAYNDLREEISKQTESGYDGGTPGALASDSATRQILSFIRNELTTAPTGITGDYTNLSSIGVSFQRDGTLELDEETLTDAIQSDNDNVAELFSSADGYATRIDAVVSELTAYNGTIDTRTDAYKDRISYLEDRELALEGRLDRTEARLRAQFTSLDVTVSRLSVTSSFLTQQLAGLSSLNVNNR